MPVSEQVFRIASVALFGAAIGFSVNYLQQAVTPQTMGSFIHDLKAVEVANNINQMRRAEAQSYSLKSIESSKSEQLTSPKLSDVLSETSK